MRKDNFTHSIFAGTAEVSSSLSLFPSPSLSLFPSWSPSPSPSCPLSLPLSLSLSPSPSLSLSLSLFYHCNWNRQINRQKGLSTWCSKDTFSVFENLPWFAKMNCKTLNENKIWTASNHFHVFTYLFEKEGFQSSPRKARGEVFTWSPLTQAQPWLNTGKLLRVDLQPLPSSSKLVSFCPQTGSRMHIV